MSRRDDTARGVDAMPANVEPVLRLLVRSRNAELLHRANKPHYSIDIDWAMADKAGRSAPGPSGEASARRNKSMVTAHDLGGVVVRRFAEAVAVSFPIGEKEDTSWNVRGRWRPASLSPWL
jgi:hypothetical protein